MIEPYDEHIDRILELGVLKQVCAWHSRFFGFEKVLREAAPGWENDGVSHGICEDCNAIVRHREGVTVREIQQKRAS